MAKLAFGQDEVRIHDSSLPADLRWISIWTYRETMDSRLTHYHHLVESRNQ